MLAAAGCGDDGAAEAGAGGDSGTDAAAPPAGPTTTVGLVPDVGPDPDLAELSLAMTEVARLDQPLVLASREGDEALFVAERGGKVFRLEPDGAEVPVTYAPDDEPLVDISDEVVLEGEQALGGMTFSPDGERLYLSYSAAPDGDGRVISYEYDEESQAVDKASRGAVLEVEQPYDTHNNGTVLFGPDGYLYIGVGDGGHIGDPHGFAQDTSTLLGSILRIEPPPTSGADLGEDRSYSIPPDNPFPESSDAQPEIWLYGVRNPWRFSFDARTGALWLGDVGQESREEINHLAAADGGGRGANLGWNQREGSQPYEGGAQPPGWVDPVFDYPNHRRGGDGGCAVIGGHVYRGEQIDALDGVYLFGDFCNPQVRALTHIDGHVTHHTPLDGLSAEGLVSLGEDAAGEVYLLTDGGPIYRIDPTPEDD